MRLLLALSLLAACAPGPSEETLVTELRVVAVVADPPEVSPAETFDVTATVADPSDEGAEVLTWLCTPVDGACLETNGHDLDAWVAVVSLDDRTARATLQASRLLAGPLMEGPDDLTIPLWTLACAPGLCPIIERVTEALRAGGSAPDDVVADLARPTEWLAELPLTGVSLAVRTVRVSTRAPEARHANPRLAEATWSEGLDEDGALALTLTLDDPTVSAVAYPFSTAGGFAEPAAPLADGQVALRYFPPSEPSAVEAFVAVQDDLGGSVVWRGTVPLRR